jgi:hypothetical protein
LRKPCAVQHHHGTSVKNPGKPVSAQKPIREIKLRAAIERAPAASDRHFLISRPSAAAIAFRIANQGGWSASLKPR